MDELTPKQNEVLALMAKGLTNGQIAERLGISLAGAKWHVSEVLSRLGVASREEAVAVWKSQHGFRARMRGLIGIPVAIQFVGSAAAVGGVAVLAVVAVAVAGGDLSDDRDEAAAQEIAAPLTSATAIPNSSGSAMVSWGGVGCVRSTRPVGVGEEVVHLCPGAASGAVQDYTWSAEHRGSVVEARVYVLVRSDVDRVALMAGDQQIAEAPVSDVGNRTVRIAVLAGQFSPVDAALVALDSAGHPLERILVTWPKPGAGAGPSFGPAERFVTEGIGQRTTATFETSSVHAEYAFVLRVEPAAATVLDLVCGDVRQEVPLNFRGENHAGFVVSPPVGSGACHFDIDTTGNWRIESK